MKKRNALNILKGYGVVLPLAVAAVYFLGPIVVKDQGDGVLIFVLLVAFISGIGGYVIGASCSGRWLTIAGIAGVCLLTAMAALLAYHVSQPIDIPPYP